MLIRSREPQVKMFSILRMSEDKLLGMKRLMKKNPSVWFASQGSGMCVLFSSGYVQYEPCNSNTMKFFGFFFIWHRGRGAECECKYSIISPVKSHHLNQITSTQTYIDCLIKLLNKTELPAKR